MMSNESTLYLTGIDPSLCVKDMPDIAGLWNQEGVHLSYLLKV